LFLAPAIIKKFFHHFTYFVTSEKFASNASFVILSVAKDLCFAVKT